MSNGCELIEAMKSKLSRRLLALILGLVVTVAIFEILLRTIGIAELSKSTSRDQAQSKHPVVVFAGNSHTLGSGAPVGRSYPDQFREILAKKYGEPPFTIVNVGRGNANSTFVADAVPGFIEKHNPTYLVVMTGETNYWNHFGFGRFHQKVHGWSFGAELYELAYWSRTFRFVQLFSEFVVKPRARDPENVFADLERSEQAYMWIAVTNNGNMYNPSTMTEGELRTAYEAVSEFLASNPNHLGGTETLMELGIARGRFDIKYLMEGLSHARNLVELSAEKYSYPVDRMLNVYMKEAQSDPKIHALAVDLIAKRPKMFELYSEFYNHFAPPAAIEAMSTEKHIEFLRTAVLYHPNQPQVRYYYFQKLVELKRISEAIDVIKDGIDLNPLANHYNWISTLRQVDEKLKQSSFAGAPALAEKIAMIIADFKKRFPAHEGRTRHITYTEIESWVKSDLERILAEAKKRNVKVLLQTYPPERHGPEKPVDRIIRDFAREHELPISDTSRHFFSIQPDSEKRKEFYTKMYGDYDNHLGESGYTEIAKILVPAFESAGWLPAPKTN